MFSHIAALCDLWRARRARASVLVSLRPFEESLKRLERENPQSLNDPYLIGFLLACVSALARDACPRIGSEGIGAVQLDVCSGLTGLPRPILAERIVCLSLGEDGGFILGCADAAAFHATLSAARAEPLDALEPGPAAQEAQALWERFVERLTAEEALRIGLPA